MAKLKPTLVLLPGLLNTARLWQNQVQALSQDYTLFFPETHHHNSLEATAEAILSQIPTQEFALAGFSMGGYVALEILRQAPNTVTRLALLNSKAEPDTENEMHQRALSLRSAQIGQFIGVTPRLMKRLVHPDQHENNNLHQIVYDMAAEIGQQGFLNQQQANMNRKDNRDILEEFQKPTLLLSGKADSIITAENTFSAQQYLPHAKTVLLEKVGHLSPLEAPEATTTALLDWLKRT